MLNQVLVIAEKETRDAIRDRRSVVSSALYALMGPLIIAFVVFATHAGQNQSVLLAMISIFALIAPFTGGMNIAMDTVAGERERQSLVPLLLNPVERTSILLGKWLAVVVFSIGSLLVNLFGVVLLLRMTGIHTPVAASALLLSVTAGIFPLALLAASAELLISTLCRSVKEAHTYLSLLVFIPMAMGMFLVFSPVARKTWVALLPVAGQQLQFERLLNGSPIELLRPAVLGLLTAGAAILILLLAGNRLGRDEIVYGN
jgi:sodium transport system permease protein